MSLEDQSRKLDNEMTSIETDSGSSGLPAGNKRTEWLAELLDWSKTLATTFAIVLLIHFFVFNLSKVEGHSMEPTLTEHEWLFVNKFVYLVGKPKIGDIVILKDPDTVEDSGKYFVKRIVGVSGDRIEIHDQRLYRNGLLVDEPYTDTLIEDMSYGPEVINEGQYFVMGDNRHTRASLDSRTFDAVPEKLISGRADFILWPFKEMRSL